jgi:hypothetical protein
VALLYPGGSATLSVTDNSRRAGGDGSIKFRLCSGVDMRNINSANAVYTENELDTDRFKRGQLRLNTDRTEPSISVVSNLAG